MERLSRIAARAADLVNHLTAALLLSMFVVFLMQILFRYLLGWPVLWTVEWVTIAWLWGILLAFAFVLTPGEMIRLDILYNAAPRGVCRAMDVFAGLVTAAIFAWTLPYAWNCVIFMKIERTAAFLWRFGLVFAVYIPFHIAVIVRMLALAWAGIAGNRPRASLAPRPESHDYD